MDAQDDTPIATLIDIRDVLIRFKNQIEQNRPVGGYSDNLFCDFDRNANQDLICNICFMVIKKAQECTNKHRFCKGCIEAWSDQGLLNSRPCPVCRVQGVYRRNRKVDQKIASLQVQCPEPRCVWIGDLKTWYRHNISHAASTGESTGETQPKLQSTTTDHVTTAEQTNLHLPPITNNTEVAHGLPDTFSRSSSSSVMFNLPSIFDNHVRCSSQLGISNPGRNESYFDFPCCHVSTVCPTGYTPMSPMCLQCKEFYTNDSDPYREQLTTESNIENSVVCNETDQTDSKDNSLFLPPIENCNTHTTDLPDNNLGRSYNDASNTENNPNIENTNVMNIPIVQIYDERFEYLNAMRNGMLEIRRNLDSLLSDINTEMARDELHNESMGPNSGTDDIMDRLVRRLELVAYSLSEYVRGDH